jgi:hypothetical protein
VKNRKRVEKIWQQVEINRKGRKKKIGIAEKPEQLESLGARKTPKCLFSTRLRSRIGEREEKIQSVRGRSVTTSRIDSGRRVGTGDGSVKTRTGKGK